MRKSWMFALVTVVVLAGLLAVRSYAGDEITINGEGMCAHCMLHQGTECQTVIQVKQGDKTMTYYLANNDVTKKFHPAVCSAKAKVTATGTVSEMDGKAMFTASKISVVKE